MIAYFRIIVRFQVRKLFPRLNMATANESLLTIGEIKKRLNKKLGARPWGIEYDETESLFKKNESFLAACQDELPARTMKDSYSQAIVPLSKDLELREKYITFMNYVRIGRMLEDLDMFAVWVTAEHICNPKLPDDSVFPYAIVTIRVDEINFDVNINIDATIDVLFTGYVSWVGSSSLEAVMKIEQVQNKKLIEVVVARFLMAVRNFSNTKSAFVNKLVASDDAERKIMDDATKRREKIKEKVESCIYKVGPNVQEQQVIHQMFLDVVGNNVCRKLDRDPPPDNMWVDETRMSTVVFSHPSNRNIHNTVFGGYLMSQALELSWSLAWYRTKQMPKLRRISDMTFLEPVKIASLLRMRSFLTYSEGNYIQIKVFASGFDPNVGETITTNEFHYTYEVENPPCRMLPRTYRDALMYLDSRRQLHEIDVNNKKDSSDNEC